MASDYTKPAGHVLVDLLNEKNGTSFAGTDFSFGLAVAQSEGSPRDTVVQIQSAPGVYSVTDRLTLQYNRVDLATVPGVRSTDFVLRTQALVSDFLPAINEMLGINLTAQDVIDSPVPPVGLFSLQASPGSLLWRGAMPLTLLEFHADPESFSLNSRYVPTGSDPLSGSNYWCSIASGNGMFIAITHYDNYYAVSTDGEIWEIRQHSLSAGVGKSWTKIVFANRQFCIFGANSTVVPVTRDGINWVQKSLLNFDDNYTDFGYHLGKWFAVSFYGYLYSSADLQNWDYYPLPAAFLQQGGSEYSQKLLSVNNTLFAIALSGLNEYFTLDDFGGTAQSRFFPSLPAGQWHSLVYGNGVYVALHRSTVTGQDSLSTSTEGINWTTPVMVAGDADHSADPKPLLVYDNGIFLMLTSSQGAYTSRDGATWTPKPTPGTGLYWVEAAFLFGNWVCAGNFDRLVTSYASPVPTNDAFETARGFVMTGPWVRVTGTLVGAQAQTGEQATITETARSNPASNTVWYSFTPTLYGLFFLSTLTSLQEDTVISVWTGSDVSSLTQIASNDQVIGASALGNTEQAHSRLFFTSLGETTYFISVDRSSDSSPLALDQIVLNCEYLGIPGTYELAWLDPSQPTEFREVNTTPHFSVRGFVPGTAEGAYEVVIDWTPGSDGDVPTTVALSNPLRQSAYNAVVNPPLSGPGLSSGIGEIKLLLNGLQVGNSLFIVVYDLAYGSSTYGSYSYGAYGSSSYHASQEPIGLFNTLEEAFPLRDNSLLKLGWLETRNISDVLTNTTRVRFGITGAPVLASDVYTFDVQWTPASDGAGRPPVISPDGGLGIYAAEVQGAPNFTGFTNYASGVAVITAYLDGVLLPNSLVLAVSDDISENANKYEGIGTYLTLSEVTLPPADINDPYFPNVALLLRGSESLPVIDQSSFARVPSAAYRIVMDTNIRKHGLASLHNIGNGGLIYPSSPAFAAGVFTCEFWLYTEDTTTQSFIMGRSGVSYITIASNSLSLTNFFGAGSGGSLPLSISTWTHVAMSKDSDGVSRLFKDGVKVAENTVPLNNTSTPLGVFGIAGRGDLPSGAHRIDDFRWTTGVCRYAANFTPPARLQLSA
jgi:hypothetical protein